MDPVSTHSADELEQYRSLSSSAILSFVLGLFSPLAFFSLLLLVVPLTGAAVALSALASIRNSAGSLLGTRLAYIGLVLSILFGVASVAKVRTQIEIFRRQADATAQMWLSHLSKGQTTAALGLQTRGSRSRLSSSPENIAIPPIFPAELLVARVEQDAISHTLAELRKSEPQGLVQRTSNTILMLSEPRAVIVYKPIGAQAENLTFEVTLMMTNDDEGSSSWLVDGWQVSRSRS